jgi:hypothetical protein
MSMGILKSKIGSWGLPQLLSIVYYILLIKAPFKNAIKKKILK